MMAVHGTDGVTGAVGGPSRHIPVLLTEVIEALRQILLRRRADHVDVKELSGPERSDVPPIALISSLRKFTS